MPIEPHYTPNLIIGAGPAGLAVAGRLRAKGLDFEIIEKSDRVTPAWHNHYDRLHLHTVKEFSSLPHRPFSQEYPRYIPRQQLVEYFEQYAKEFDIKPHFGEEVISVHKENEQWVTETASGATFISKNVIICTGYNRTPNRPTWEGQDEFHGSILHSAMYKSGKAYKGQRVLVVGMGNSGAEIALDLWEQGAQSFISVRGPVNIIARDILGRPTQLTAMKLGKLPDWLGNWIGVQAQRFSIGNLSKYGLETLSISPNEQLRRYGKTPVIDIGTVEQIKAGNIKVLPGIERFYADGILFKNGETLPFDAVVLATGYRAKVEDFLEDAEGVLNEHRVPKQPIGEGKYKGLYFVGFSAYSSGILFTIYKDSEKVVDAISAA